MAMAYDQGDLSNDTLQQLKNTRKELRITRISPLGEVLFETDTDKDKTENHLNRPEVQLALDGKFGQDERKSETMGKDTIYMAMQLPNDDVLRLARERDSLMAVTWSLLPDILVLTVIAFLILLYQTNRSIKRVVEPIETAAEDLERIGKSEIAMPDDIYPELIPFYRKLGEQSRSMLDAMEKIKDNNLTVERILEQMAEGVILLDGEGKIISINTAAKTFFDVPLTEDLTGKSLSHVHRNLQIQEKTENALKGERDSMRFNYEGHPLTIYFSPGIGENQRGVMLFIADVTEEKRGERLRREFSANVSHELKSPLTSINGYAELIATGMAQGGDVQKFAGIIYQEGNRLLELIDTIMKLSRIEENGEEEKSPLSIKNEIEYVMKLKDKEIKEKDLEVDVDVEEAILSGHEVMLQEIIMNLFSNAIKYNVPQGKISLKGRVVDDHYRLVISDTGIGMNPEDLKRAFERFYVADKGRNRERKSSGLGLAIVKHAVEVLQGRIRLESEEGKGTTAILELPLWSK